MLDLFMAGSFNRSYVRIVGMDTESTAGLGFNVEVELEFLISGRKIQSGKFLGQGGADIGLNLLLQLFACRGLERRQGGIAGVGDEPSFGLGFDALSKRADDAFKFHGIWRDCSVLCRG